MIFPSLLSLFAFVIVYCMYNEKGFGVIIYPMLLIYF
jgi:hypothetical protein